MMMYSIVKSYTANKLISNSKTEQSYWCCNDQDRVFFLGFLLGWTEVCVSQRLVLYMFCGH